MENAFGKKNIDAVIDALRSIRKGDGEFHAVIKPVKKGSCQISIKGCGNNYAMLQLAYCAASSYITNGNDDLSFQDVLARLECIYEFAKDHSNMTNVKKEVVEDES